MNKILFCYGLHFGSFIVYEWNIYDENTAKPKDEDFLLGKAVDANYEKGTLGQINAVEYGEILFYT